MDLQTAGAYLSTYRPELLVACLVLWSVRKFLWSNSGCPQLGRLGIVLPLLSSPCILRPPAGVSKT